MKTHKTLDCHACFWPLQDAAYGGDPKWISNDEVTEHDGRIYLSLPASCTLMLVQQ